MRTMRRLLVRLAAGLLALHFVFIWLLARHVSVVGVLLFVAAMSICLPPLRRRLAAVPLLGRPSVLALMLLLLLVVANDRLVAGNRAEIEREPLALVGATVISGRLDAAPIEDAVVLVDDEGRISAVGARAEVPVPSGTRVIDLAGRYLMPGLVNAHAHLLMTGRKPDEKLEQSSLRTVMASDLLVELMTAFLRSYPGRQIVMALMEKNAQIALRAGVTTLRGLGDPNFVDVALRDRIARGEFLGPRLLVSGPLLCTTGGHAHQIALVFDGPDEARRAVRTAMRKGVDVIKIASTGGVTDSRRIGEAGELQMTPEEIAAVTDEAHRKNVLVAAHAESAQGVKEALRAGVDSIEHGAELDAESLRLFNNNPKSLRGYTTLHPTLAVVGPEMELTDEIRADPDRYVFYMNGQEIKRRMLIGYKQAVDGGVKVAVGTDAGITHHSSVWTEMRFFVEIGGLTNAEALHLGTLGTAESIGVDAITGSVEAGKFADFVIVDANPLDDLSTLANPRLVVAAGVVVDPQL
jgi:imidazolonepropionase-like amidohydrolase